MLRCLQIARGPHCARCSGAAGGRKGEKGREEEESGECVGVKVREEKDGGVL